MTIAIDAPRRGAATILPQLGGLYAIWLREVKRAIRDKGQLFGGVSSPLPRATVLLGKILGGTTVALFHGSLVLALARFADLTLTPADIAKGLGLMFLLAFALCSLGVVIANRVRSFEGFGVFSNAVILPLYFTSS